MSSAEGVVEVGGNEINEGDVFYAPFTCESDQLLKSRHRIKFNDQ